MANEAGPTEGARIVPVTPDRSHVYAALVLALLLSRPSAAADELRVALSGGSIQPGALLLLTIAAPDAVQRLTVHALGHDIEPFRINPHTWQALVGVDLATPPGTYQATVTASTAFRTLTAREALRVQPRQFPTRRLRVDPSFVEPPPDAVERIAREAGELSAAWLDTATTRLWSGRFLRPVNDASGGQFGARSVFNGTARAPHGGEDFASPAGTPIHAPNAGRVVLARNFYFTGNTVIVDHGLGLFSLFAHLSAFDVREGDLVAAGQRLGTTGATGRVTGPHLHWAVRAGGARVDPLSVLSLLGRKTAD